MSDRDDSNGHATVKKTKTADSAKDQGVATAVEKWCFVISPIGDDSSDTRKRSNIVFDYLIEPACTKCGYSNVKRADKMDGPGLITSQIVNAIVEAPLVVADLTDLNPNVMYELALAHAMKKPTVQLMHQASRLPFDVSSQRTIFYDHQDIPRTFKETLPTIIRQIQIVEEDPDVVDNPISTAMELKALKSSGDPKADVLSKLLSMMTELHNRKGGLGTDLSSHLASNELQRSSRALGSAMVSGNSFTLLEDINGEQVIKHVNPKGRIRFYNIAGKLSESEFLDFANARGSQEPA